MQNQSREEREALWKDRIVRFEQSGLSIKKFCEKEHIPLSTFNWWRKKIKEEVYAPGGFIELSGKAQISRFEGKNFILHLPGIGTLEIPQGSSLSCVKELVRVLLEAR